MREQWSKEKAWEWYMDKPWVMGINYVPSITLHALELWQGDTYAEVIPSVRRELLLMQDIGLNSVRMFLPFELWYHERDHFLDRVDTFLGELSACGISMMPVIFNDCVGFSRPSDLTPPFPRGWHAYEIGHHGGHHENPFTGEKERRGWIYWDEEAWRPVMQSYLRALIERFGRDTRIYAWDLWNEPGNSNRHNMSMPYLKCAFETARELDPVQPLTAGAWSYPASFGKGEDVEPIERLALSESDIITFHQYENAARVRKVVTALKKLGRPMLNTEWLNRILDNLVEDNLPLFHDEGIGSYSWGLVAGKSQHFLPWDELWKNRELPLYRWQHDLFDTFHTPYDPVELELMRSLSPRRKGKTDE